MIELSSNLTLYVRGDGNNSNSGLSDTAADAFLTLQHAYDFAANTYILTGGKLTIQMNAGQFSGLETARGILGCGLPEDVTIRGSGATTEVVPAAGATSCIGLGLGYCGNAILCVDNFKVTAPGGYGLISFGGGCGLHYKNITFGACNAHVTCVHNSWVYQSGPCAVVGDANMHLAVGTNGVLATHNAFLAFSVPVTFSYGFAAAGGGGRLYAAPMSFYAANTVSGPKFQIGPGGSIDIGGDVNYLPGTLPGANDRGFIL